MRKLQNCKVQSDTGHSFTSTSIIPALDYLLLQCPQRPTTNADALDALRTPRGMSTKRRTQLESTRKDTENRNHRQPCRAQKKLDHPLSTSKSTGSRPSLPMVRLIDLWFLRCLPINLNSGSNSKNGMAITTPMATLLRTIGGLTVRMLGILEVTRKLCQ
ncbi:hypothetical protein B0H34DRAFT_691757 [Crassisporium funariophilum]|nr:hypothetical protein B0H34DRAFT_691757 [Crassisporium funariophilum]